MINRQWKSDLERAALYSEWPNGRQVRTLPSPIGVDNEPSCSSETKTGLDYLEAAVGQQHFVLAGHRVAAALLLVRVLVAVAVVDGVAEAVVAGRLPTKQSGKVSLGWFWLG